jgi:hypothetical protein
MNIHLSSDVPLPLFLLVTAMDLLQVIIAIAPSSSCTVSTTFIRVGGFLLNWLNQILWGNLRSELHGKMLLQHLIKGLLLGGNDERCRDLLGGCRLDLLRDHLILLRNFDLITISILDIIRGSLLNLLSRRNKIDLLRSCLLSNLRLLMDDVDVVTR